jgi:hypothetical protein
VVRLLGLGPYGTLDKETAARFVSAFAEGLEFIPVYPEQLARWQRTKLTDTERNEVYPSSRPAPPLGGSP